MISQLDFSHSVSIPYGLVVTGVMQALCSPAVQNEILFFSSVSKNMQMLCWVGQHESCRGLHITPARLLCFCSALSVISIVRFVFIFLCNKSFAESFQQSSSNAAKNDNPELLYREEYGFLN